MFRTEHASRSGMVDKWSGLLDLASISSGVEPKIIQCDNDRYFHKDFKSFANSFKI